MNDWREDLLYTMTDTKGCCFAKAEFNPLGDNDHEHCSICFEKISYHKIMSSETVAFFCKETNDWLEHKGTVLLC